MAASVAGVDGLLPDIGTGARLALLVVAGAAAYAGFLIAFARPIVDEVHRPDPADSGRPRSAQTLWM